MYFQIVIQLFGYSAASVTYSEEEEVVWVRNVLVPFKRAMVVSYRLSIVTIVLSL